MMDLFTGLVLIALIGGGFLIVRRMFERRNTMNPPMGMPWQQGYGPADEYERSFNPNAGYDGPRYGRPMYGPQYGDARYGRAPYGPGYDPVGYNRPMYGPGYAPQSGMSPLAAGGLGALGGGLLGYELGQMVGEHEQQAQAGDLMQPEQVTTLAQEGYDPGMADSIGTFDGGGFADFGGDFGGGDFEM
jgi:hypothetical protein